MPIGEASMLGGWSASCVTGTVRLAHIASPAGKKADLEFSQSIYVIPQPEAERKMTSSI